MGQRQHWAIFINNRSDKGFAVDLLMRGTDHDLFTDLQGQRGALFSKLELNRFMDEEERHDKKIITKGVAQSLKSMSSGEQKKALLKHLLKTQPDFLILDNPFDNLDTETQADLVKRLQTISEHTPLVQIVSRSHDLLPFITQFVELEGRSLRRVRTRNPFGAVSDKTNTSFTAPIPPPLVLFSFDGEALIAFKNVSVQYGGRPILRDINWQIGPGEFWQLIGKNGSGKTTLLSMITGENSKGYGQELYIFGQKKGSGESIWDIKKRIGYFTPAMTDKFTGYHSLEHMLISGLHDSVGLYVKPSEAELRLAKEWLQLIGLWELKDTYFHEMSMGNQRLLMTVRAMIKHPLLLILDEPTAGLDDTSAALFVALVNKIAKESSTAIVFVSHRKEKGLEPQFIYALTMHESGSIGKML
ncbi:ATP-binding cassette domain-containing protein [Flavobacteriaceae bacterium 3-367]|uniref:ABC transporter ATP-binding protein n=1 Tax=Eudoraea algarum TaxID=3417568 RepID=UPI003277197F